ncbi:hypothetical protein [Streptomyces sp. enrichment culture]|uniref:hypothetical protein n=1 Tax=Streptomyces sp. enrichment culture TaxID=1795815 RepID=UPI003F57CFCD
MRKSRLLTAVLSVGMLTALSTATAQATTSSEASVQGCKNWSVTSSWGFASGINCGWQATGTVTDTKADGRCPFVLGHKFSGGMEDSDWAGPKGDTSPVEIYASTTDPFVSFTMDAIYC